MEYNAAQVPTHGMNDNTTPTNLQIPSTASQHSAVTWSSRPQFTAVATASIIFLSAGMNLALSVGWFQYSVVGPMQHFCYSWFIGVIIGTIASIPLRNLISTRILRGISALLIFLGAILFSIGPNTGDVLLAGRYLNGIAVGLSIVPFIMYTTELADDSRRGSLLALEQCFITCGIAIQMIYTSYWSSDMDFPANRAHAFLDGIFAMLAWGSLRKVTESPMVSMRKGDDAAALEALACLHRPPIVTMETHIMLEQRKTYIQQEQRLTVWQSLGEGIAPLLKMLLFRSVILALSNSLTLNMGFHYSMAAKSVTWVPVVAALCRIAGSFISLCVADRRRKLPSLLYGVSIAGLCLNHAKLFYNIYDTVNLAMAKYWYIAIQLVVGLYVPYTTVYLTEAFPLRVKPYMMAVCVVIEQILQIILICTTKPLIAQDLSIQGSLIFAACLLWCFTIPETSHTLLAEAQLRFRKLFHLQVK